MLRFIALTKSVFASLFASFMSTRLLAELPGADDLIVPRRDNRTDDPRMGGCSPPVGMA